MSVRSLSSIRRASRWPLGVICDLDGTLIDSAPDIAAEALYIGDMAVDVQTARAANMTVLLADFGYATTPATELGADAVFGHWQVLEQIMAPLAPGAAS